MRANAEKEASQLGASTKLDAETKLVEASLTAERNRAKAGLVLEPEITFRPCALTAR